MIILTSQQTRFWQLCTYRYTESRNTSFPAFGPLAPWVHLHAEGDGIYAVNGLYAINCVVGRPGRPFRLSRPPYHRAKQLK